MGSVLDEGAYDALFGAQSVGVDPGDGVSSEVVVAVSVGPAEVALVDPVLVEGFEDPHLVVLGDIVVSLEGRGDQALCLFHQVHGLVFDAVAFIYKLSCFF